MLSGELIVDDDDDNDTAAADVRLALLNRRGIVGGGSMDISSAVNSPNPAQQGVRSSSSSRTAHGHKRSASLLALLSPSLSDNNTGAGAGAFGFGVRSEVGLGKGGGGGGGGVGEDLKDAVLPTFESQPAMLAVDLSLAPGESRSCNFPFFF